MLFTRKNIIKGFAIAIPIFVINLFEVPFESFLRDIPPSFELGVLVAISIIILTILVGTISVLVCIKIWNSQSAQINED